jgi:hypothetical protein
VRPLLDLRVRHYLRDEVLLDDLLHARFKNVYNPGPALTVANLEKRKPRRLCEPIGHLGVQPELRLIPPRTDGGEKCPRIEDYLVGAHSTLPAVTETTATTL